MCVYSLFLIQPRCPPISPVRRLVEYYVVERIVSLGEFIPYVEKHKFSVLRHFVFKCAFFVFPSSLLRLFSLLRLWSSLAVLECTHTAPGFFFSSRFLCSDRHGQLISTGHLGGENQTYTRLHSSGPATLDIKPGGSALLRTRILSVKTSRISQTTPSVALRVQKLSEHKIGTLCSGLYLHVSSYVPLLSLHGQPSPDCVTPTLLWMPVHDRVENSRTCTT